MKNETVTPPKQEPPKSIVRAVRVLAFRCPDCGLMQFTEKSSTYTGECNRCAAIITVDIKRQV